MRAVNDRFRNDLKDGILAQLRRAVISDPSLCLELRELHQCLLPRR